MHTTTATGLLVVRKTSAAMGPEAFAVLGVLHFPKAITVRESVPYVVSGRGGGLTVGAEVDNADDMDTDSIESYGVNGLLKASLWRRSAVPHCFTARFLKAFGDSNGWVTVGLADTPPWPRLQFNRTGHAWVSIDDGKAVQVPGPGEACETGKSCACLLRNLFVWPDAHGVPHNLPVLDSRYRTALHRAHVLRARVGLGEITASEVSEEIQTSRVLGEAWRDVGSSCRFDGMFEQYLTHLYRRGLLEPEKPMTAVEEEARSRAAQEIIEHVVLATRSSELQGIAHELGVPQS